MTTGRRPPLRPRELAALRRAHRALPPPPRPQSVPKTPPPPPLHDGFAVAALVLGLLWLGGLGSVLALVFGSVSAGQARRAGRRKSGMATAGQILGGCGLLLLLVLIIGINGG